MAEYVSVPQFLQAWKIPYWGHRADEPAPSWLVSKLMSRELTINHMGGLSAISEIQDDHCYCGDYVVLRGDGSIAFCDPNAFEAAHEIVRA